MSDRLLERMGAACGIVYVVLLIVGPSIGGLTSPVAFFLEVLAFLFFLFFLGRLWSVLRRAEKGSGWISTTAFGAGLMAVTIKLASAAPVLAARHMAGDGLDPQLARTLQDMNDASFALTFFPLAVLLATFAIVTIRSGALPRWLGWTAAVIAVSLIAGGTAGSADLESEWAGLAMLLFMLWVLAASVVLILRAGEPRPVQTEAPPVGPADRWGETDGKGIVMSERLWKWGGIAAMLGGALWALTPLRQDVFRGGRFPESPIFRPYNFVILVIAALLIMGLVALHTRHKETYRRLGTAGVVVIFVGYALLFVGSLPAVSFPSGGLRDVIMIGQDLGFFGALIAGAGAILLGGALWRARAVPRSGALLLIISLPVGLPGVIALQGIGLVDSTGLALTVLYGGAWIILGHQLWAEVNTPAQHPSRVR